MKQAYSTYTEPHKLMPVTDIAFVSIKTRLLFSFPENFIANVLNPGIFNRHELCVKCNHQCRKFQLSTPAVPKMSLLEHP